MRLTRAELVDNFQLSACLVGARLSIIDVGDLQRGVDVRRDSCTRERWSNFARFEREARTNVRVGLVNERNAGR
jgi:hypothetical protein